MKKGVLSLIVAFLGTVGGLTADTGFIPEDEDEEGEFVELLRNGACDGTFDGWEESDLSGWGIETDEDGSCYWASGYQECVLSQTIIPWDAGGICEEDIDSGKVVYQASAMVRVKWGSRIAEARVEELDESGEVLNTETVLDIGETSAVEEWEYFETSLCTLTPGTRRLRYVVRGQDRNKWAGYYGPCFKNLSLKAKVIGSVVTPPNGDGMASPFREPENGAIYNLAGQRLSKMQKGINIVGDKKVLIK